MNIYSSYKRTQRDASLKLISFLARECLTLLNRGFPLALHLWLHSMLQNVHKTSLNKFPIHTVTKRTTFSF